MDGWIGPSIGRIPPEHWRRPAQEYQDIKDTATYGRQPQVSPLSPTGVQAVLTTNGGIAKYLACASGSQSESVYHLYQELLRPS